MIASDEHSDPDPHPDLDLDRDLNRDLDRASTSDQELTANSSR